MSEFVRNPLVSLKGPCLSIDRGAVVEETGGRYGAERYVYQAIARIGEFDGARLIIGSWMIDGVAVGIGLRESATPITDNSSSFVPRLFE